MLFFIASSKCLMPLRDKNLQSLHAGQGVDDVIHLIVSMEEPDSLLLTQDRQNCGKWRVQETHSF